VELIECPSRGRGSFIKHLLFLSWIFQFTRAWLSPCLPIQIGIGDEKRMLLPQLPDSNCSRKDEKA
jgi:hypothetical protein